MRPAAASAVVFMFMVAAGSAQATSLSTLKKRDKQQTASLYRHAGTVRFFANHPWLLKYGPEPQRWTARKALKRARIWVRIIRQERAETRAALEALAHPPNDWAEFSCIYGYEKGPDGPATNTGNGFYGGLQMDEGFQSTYGREFLRQWGTADKWPVWAQVVAARRARDGYGRHGARGYGPWPNTARLCGQL